MHVFLMLREFAAFFEDLGECPRLDLGPHFVRSTIYFILYLIDLYSLACILYLYVADCPELYMYYAYSRYL